MPRACQFNRFKVNLHVIENIFSVILCILVPAPIVSITVTGLTLDTVSILTCTVTLTDPKPPSPNITISITKDGQPVTNNSITTISLVYDTVMKITFTSLAFYHFGNYVCTAMIDNEGSGFAPSIEPFIVDTSNSTSYILTVSGMYQNSRVYYTSQHAHVQKPYLSKSYCHYA